MRQFLIVTNQVSCNFNDPLYQGTDWLHCGTLTQRKAHDH